MQLPTAMPDDAPHTTVSASTSADPTTLWALVTDPSASAPFSEEFQGARWKDTAGVTPPALGARFIGRNARKGTEWTTLCTVTEHEHERAFGWTVMDLTDPVSSWTFRITPTDAGADLSYTALMGPSMLSGLNQAIAEHPDKREAYTTGRLDRLARSIQATVEGLIELAEQGA
ncbi:MAG: hypothetical protein ACJA2F_000425 [Nitriliruptoraceae bacterium]|jgi:hypothetical protein